MLPIKPTQNKYQLKELLSQKNMAPISTIKLTTKYALNDRVVGLNSYSMLLVRCFVSIPLAVKHNGVTIPNITGMNDLTP